MPTSSEFTKGAGLDKARGMSKLVMFCNKEYAYRMIYLNKTGDYRTKELAWYYFMTCFESSAVSGESGAHLHVIDMDIAKKPVAWEHDMWPISVTLNITLEQYRRLRKKKRFRIWTSAKLRKPEPMPRFKELEPK